MTHSLDRREFLATMAAATAAFVVPSYGSSADRSKQQPELSSRIAYGADYYAEDWPPERIETDAKLMQQAKFSTVRLVDTNWERLEPEEGRFNFAWLDRVVEILSRYGIRSILGTSSYVPPAWLVARHPDFYLVNESGVRRHWGGMGSMCLNHPLYLQHVEKLILALASRYGRNPAVVGWQIDNEMGAWGYACYDEEHCVPKFRQYLKTKFGTLEDFNRRLFTVSYGHIYSSWDQIQLPSSAAEEANQVPLLLEGQRFFSANITDFLRFQADLLRQHTSGQFITHNGPNRIGNCFDYARPLDFLCADSYPLVGNYIEPGYDIDLMRGFNHGKSFQVLEQRSGTFGSATLGDATPPPGLARLWAWQTLAHGADGVLFFRWRRNNGGSEQYWQGLLNYDGTPEKVFSEVVRMGTELEKAGPEFHQAESPSQVAVMLSYDSYWALQIGDARTPYFDELKVFSSSFRRWGMNADIVEPTDDLQKYKIVVCPALQVVTPSIVENLERFVSGGGVLILTARSGFKTVDNLATAVPPGLLQHLAKVWTKQFTILDPLPEPTVFGFPSDTGAHRPSPENFIESGSQDWPGPYKARVWADILELDGATAMFRYGRDFFSGQPAVTLADYGRGKVVYVGTLLEPRFYFDLARKACGWAQVEHGPEIPEAVDFALRQTRKRSFRFFLNFSDSAKTVRVPGESRDLLSGRTFSDEITIPGLDLCILVSSSGSQENESR